MPQEVWEMGGYGQSSDGQSVVGLLRSCLCPAQGTRWPLLTGAPSCSPPATKAWTRTPNTYAHFHPVLCCVGPDQPDPWPPSRCLQLFLLAVRVSRWWALTRMLILSPACGGTLWCFILASRQGVQFLRHWDNDQIIIITPASEFAVLQTLCFLHSCWVAS